MALWLPPGAEPDGDAIAAVLADTVSPEQHEDMFSVLEQREAAHPAIRTGTAVARRRPAQQGKGFGGQLLAQCLAIVDASHQPAYLETPNPRTVPFYERHGFEAIGVAQAGACPPLTFMRRAAREA